MTTTVEVRQQPTPTPAKPRQRAWQTIRIMRVFTSRDVETAAEVSKWQAMRYIREFHRLGHIERTGTGQPYTYRLKKDQVNAPENGRDERITNARRKA